MTTPYTLPEPFYRHGSGDIPSYGASQLKAAFASGAASKEFDIRGKLASSLKCWHRLSADEANELIAFAASRDAEIEALRADAAKWREHVKPKIVGWMNPCNGVVISPSKKLSRSIGHGYPNFSVPVFAAIAAEGGKT